MQPLRDRIAGRITQLEETRNKTQELFGAASDPDISRMYHIEIRILDAMIRELQEVLTFLTSQN